MLYSDPVLILTGVGHMTIIGRSFYKINKAKQKQNLLADSAQMARKGLLLESERRENSMKRVSQQKLRNLHHHQTRLNFALDLDFRHWQKEEGVK